VLAHHRDGERAAVIGELQVPVVGDDDQPVALHPPDGLTDRGPALPEALGDPGAQRDHALLLELVNRPEVHLSGVDELVHAITSQAR
jgi:hypothetical protein